MMPQFMGQIISRALLSQFYYVYYVYQRNLAFINIHGDRLDRPPLRSPGFINNRPFDTIVKYPSALIIGFYILETDLL